MENKTKLFTTYDGYDVFEGDSYFYVNESLPEHSQYRIHDAVARDDHVWYYIKHSTPRFKFRKYAEIYLALHSSKSLESLAEKIKDAIK